MRAVLSFSSPAQVLATGLSALYSSLPRKLEVRGDDWHFLRREDWIGVPSLVLFMNSLEFCNAVIQVGLLGGVLGCGDASFLGGQQSRSCLGKAGSWPGPCCTQWCWAHHLREGDPGKGSRSIGPFSSFLVPQTDPAGRELLAVSGAGLLCPQCSKHGWEWGLLGGWNLPAPERPPSSSPLLDGAPGSGGLEPLGLHYGVEGLGIALDVSSHCRWPTPLFRSSWWITSTMGSWCLSWGQHSTR